MASSGLPPAPEAGPRSPADTLRDLADRMGVSVLTLMAGGIGALVILAGVALALTRSEAPPPELSIPYAAPAAEVPRSEVPAEEPTIVMAHAAGAVERPGVYALDAGVRVGDLITAAGGPTSEADLNRLNLAAPVVDGSRVYVPRVDEEQPPGVLGPDVMTPGSSGTAPGPSGPGSAINVNTADAAQLETLPGVGPSTAAAIIAHREAHGPFATVDDLIDVRGIGEAKLAAIRDLVSV